MLGKTNLIFNVENESEEIALIRENVLTEYSGNFNKIKYMNGNFFAIDTERQIIVYGEEINALQKIDLKGVDVLFANGMYYITTMSQIYESADLITFNVLNINAETTGTHLLWHDDEKNIFIILIYNQSGISLYTAENLTGNLAKKASTNIKIDYANALWPSLYGNHRLIFRVNITYAIKGLVYDLNGNADNAGYYPLSYAGGYFWIDSSGKIYKSLNGIEYSKVYEDNTDDFGELVCVFEYAEKIAFIVSKKQSETDYYIVVAANTSGKAIENAMLDRVPFSLEYNLKSVLCINDVIYLGCSGGVIVKAYFDVKEEENLPEVSLIKTLSARQALEESKAYTKEQLAILEARILELENKSLVE